MHPQRLFWRANLGKVQNSAELIEDKEIRRIVPEEEANLVGSLTDDGQHMPVIDIDNIPVRVVPSSTPGNCHLYIDKAMTWDQYKFLLDALYVAGIIEHGYHAACVARKLTFVRKPGVLRESPRSSKASGDSYPF